MNSESGDTAIDLIHSESTGQSHHPAGRKRSVSISLAKITHERALRDASTRTNRQSDRRDSDRTTGCLTSITCEGVSTVSWAGPASRNFI